MSYKPYICSPPYITHDTLARLGGARTLIEIEFAFINTPQISCVAAARLRMYGTAATSKCVGWCLGNHWNEL